jgi:hypothetical protein
MADTYKPKAKGSSDFDRAESRLAHWPPPFRNSQTPAKGIKHPPGEPAKRAKPRGWRLTRAMFSEFEED